jgi:hypothetical protein
MVAFAPAGVGAGVAHRALRHRFHQQGIVIAIYQQLLQVQKIAAFFAFGPQAFF